MPPHINELQTKTVSANLFFNGEIPKTFFSHSKEALHTKIFKSGRKFIAAAYLSPPVRPIGKSTKRIETQYNKIKP